MKNYYKYVAMDISISKMTICRQNILLFKTNESFFPSVLQDFLLISAITTNSFRGKRSQWESMGNTFYHLYNLET